MAKTKRSKKSKEQIMSETLRLRVLTLLILFVIIIAALKTGVIGGLLHLIVSFLFGNVYGLIYAAGALLCIYVIYIAKLPRFNGPIALGLYLLFIAILLFASIPSDTTVKGVGMINNYIQSCIVEDGIILSGFNKGGFFGVLLFGVFSGLFGYIGAVIFAVVVLIIASALLYSKLYFNHNKKKKKKVKTVHTDDSDDVKTIVLKKKAHFFDFSNKETVAIFPDKAFEEPVKKESSKDIAKTFTFDDDQMQMDFSEEKEEISKKEIVEEVKKEEVKPEVKEEVKLSIKNEKTPVTYKLPSIDLLSTKSTNNTTKEKNTANKNAARLTALLQEFGVNASIENAFIGPAITKYEIKLETGTRVNKILQLQDDIKLALATADVRIEAPIPGKPYVGIEVPNSSSSMVAFKDVYKALMNEKSLDDNKVVVALGKDVAGKPVFAELNKMPHLLIAGATGSGKSVCVNTIISSILMRAKPDEVKMILVDPKKVELSMYNGIPHLLSPVVTDPKKAAAVLHEVVAEMERRYDVFASVNARNIAGYNEFAKEYNKNKNEDEQKEILPFIVVILDEVADLMMVASKDVEDCIMRISQMARAAGIHLIVATQRPSTDIITGVIKANIPSRIAFAVSSGIDSRTILDTSGAEKLLGKGDMLFSPMGASSPKRVQGCFVSDDEVNTIVHYVTSQQQATYDDKYVNAKSMSQTSSSSSDTFDDEDEEYEMCREFVIQAQKASTSLLQRKFRIGYNKAARIIDQLEEDGVIGPQLGSKPREVYIRQYNEEEI